MSLYAYSLRVTKVLRKECLVNNTLEAYYLFLPIPQHCFSISLRSPGVDFWIELLAIDPLTGKEECLVNILAACYPATLPARTASYLEKAATMPSPSFSLAHILIHTGRLLFQAVDPLQNTRTRPLAFPVWQHG